MYEVGKAILSGWYERGGRIPPQAILVQTAEGRKRNQTENMMSLFLHRMERTTLFRLIPFANLSETHVSASVLLGMIEMALCKIAH